MVRVLIAPDAYSKVLTAGQVTQAIAQGWSQQCPHDELTCCPLSDGGSGFIDAVQRAVGGQLLSLTVTGPLGDPVPATILVTEGVAGMGIRTAYLQASQACGPELLSAPDLLRANSFGVGELIQAAVQTGVQRIVIGVGASASHDGGMGLLAGLGVGDPDQLAGGAGSVFQLAADALAGLAALRDRLSGIELVLATAVDTPLTGFHGASATDAVSRGATARQAQDLEAALGRYADIAQRSLVAGRLLAGSGLAAASGAGAGGGVGFALLLLGARQVNGVEQTLAATGFAELLATTDLMVTGQRIFDGQSLRGGVIPVVAAHAQQQAVPVVVIAQEVQVGRREALAIGVQGAYAVNGAVNGSIEMESGADGGVASGPAAALAVSVRARRVARTWSPGGSAGGSVGGSAGR